MKSQDEQLQQVFNRHIGRTMGFLDDVKSPKVLIEAVKKELWSFCDDIKIHLSDVNYDYATPINKTMGYLSDVNSPKVLIESVSKELDLLCSDVKKVINGTYKDYEQKR